MQSLNKHTKKKKKKIKQGKRLKQYSQVPRVTCKSFFQKLQQSRSSSLTVRFTNNNEHTIFFMALEGRHSWQMTIKIYNTGEMIYRSCQPHPIRYLFISLSLFLYFLSLFSLTTTYFHRFDRPFP